MQFLVLTRDGAQVSLIDDYESFEMKERAYSQSTLNLVVDPHSARSEELMVGRFLAVHGESTPTAFMIEQREINIELIGRTTVRCKEVGLFDNRLTIPNDGESHDSFTGPAESAQKHYVIRHVGSSAGIERRLPNLDIEADSGRGNSVTIRSRYQQLDRVLERIGTSSGIGWRTVYNRATKRFEFRTIDSVDRSADVLLSIDMDSLTSERILIDNTDHKNHALVGGQGQGELRDIELVWAGEQVSIYSQLVLDHGPAGYWRLGEAAGETTAVDSSGNGHDGTWQNGSPPYGANGLLVADDDTAVRLAKADADWAALSSDGVADTGNEISAEAWFLPDALPSTTNYGPQFIAEQHSMDTGVRFTLGFVESGLGTVMAGVYDGSWHRAVSPTKAVVGEAEHWIGTYDGTDIRLYRNGAEVASTAYAGPLPSTGSNWRIGRRWDTADYLDGVLDEVALYDRALTADEIKSHYEAGAQPTGPIEWNRREAFLDARDIDQGDLEALRDRGDEGLKAAQVVESFEVDVHTFGSFKYGEHWNLCDLVRVRSSVESIDKAMRVLSVITAYSRGSLEQTVELDRAWPTLEDRISGTMGINTAGENTV